MKCTGILFACLLLGILGRSTVSGEIVLIDSVRHNGGGTDKAVGVAVDASRNVYVAGTRTSTTPPLTFFNLVRYSPTLTAPQSMHWQATGSQSTNETTDLAVHQSGEAVVVGAGYSPGVANILAMVSRFDSNLSQIYWQYWNQGEANFRKVTDVSLSSGGTYVSVIGDKMYFSQPKKAGFLVRYNNLGSIDWVDERYVQSNQNVEWYGQAVTIGGGSVFVGYKNKTTIGTVITTTLQLAKFADSPVKTLQAQASVAIGLSDDIHDLLYIPTPGRLVVITSNYFYCFDNSLNVVGNVPLRHFNCLTPSVGATFFAAGISGIAKYDVSGSAVTEVFCCNDNVTYSAICSDGDGNVLAVGDNGADYILKWIPFYASDSFAIESSSIGGAGVDVAVSAVGLSKDTFYVTGTSAGASNNDYLTLRVRYQNICNTTTCPGGHCAGDVNGDGTTNILDHTFLVNRMFRGGPAPSPTCRGDVNGDGASANILDLTYMTNFIFRGGPAPNCPPDSCP